MEITNSVMDDFRFRLLEQSYFTEGEEASAGSGSAAAEERLSTAISCLMYRLLS